MIGKIFVGNIWLKIASLILSIILWFFVVMSGHSVVMMSVPVKFINMPSEIDMVDMVKSIRLDIEGQDRLLKGITQEDISVVVDLASAKAGTYRHTFSTKEINLPNRLNIKRIFPQTISLVFEERMRKTVAVKPVIVGLPTQGFDIEGITLTPDKVEIEGPKSHVKRIYSVKTEPLDVTGTVESLHVTAFLDMPQPNVRSEIKEIEVDILIGNSE